MSFANDKDVHQNLAACRSYTRCNHPGRPAAGSEGSPGRRYHLRRVEGVVSHTYSSATFLCLLCFFVCRFPVAEFGRCRVQDVLVTIMTGTYPHNKSCILLETLTQQSNLQNAATKLEVPVSVCLMLSVSCIHLLGSLA